MSYVQISWWIACSNSLLFIIARTYEDFYDDGDNNDDNDGDNDGDNDDDDDDDRY